MIEEPNTKWEQIHQLRRRLNISSIRLGNFNSSKIEDNSTASSTINMQNIEADVSVSGSWTGRMRAIQVAEDEALEQEFIGPTNKQSRYLCTQSISNKKDRETSRNNKLSDEDNLSSDILFSSTWSSRGFLRESALELKNIAKNDPPITTALSVSSAAVLGAMVMGPVGLLVGAASVGVAAGFMQIPEERIKCFSKSALHFMQKVCLSIEDTNEIIYNRCGEESVKHESNEIASFLGRKTHGSASPQTSNLEIDKEYNPINYYYSKRKTSSELSSLYNHGTNDLISLNGTSSVNNNVSVGKNLRYRRAAYRRKEKIIPVSKIHSLPPSKQPRAWLDVMASIFTTLEEKNEAMEEILILSKDKNNARMFLEEGIIDSLLYIIRIFFQSYVTKDINMTNGIKTFLSPNIDPQLFHAKLASNCCIALGKAHCALVHTEGDLLLMSSYYHGIVPVSRQLAQMLHEVPYNIPISSEIDRSESFKCAEISFQGAEDLAKCIFELAEGRISTYNQCFR